MDGKPEISNNLAERRGKPFVIGFKNFLLANIPVEPATGKFCIVK
ncbi:MAG: hypothetical protein RR337_10825 [Clostridia bacterium]